MVGNTESGYRVKFFPEKIEELKERIENLEKDLGNSKEVPKKNVWRCQIQNHIFTKREEAKRMVLAVIRKIKPEEEIMEYRGIKIYKLDNNKVYVGEGKEIALVDEKYKLFSDLDKSINEIEKTIAKEKEKLKIKEKQLREAKEQLKLEEKREKEKKKKETFNSEDLKKSILFNISNTGEKAVLQEMEKNINIVLKRILKKKESKIVIFAMAHPFKINNRKINSYINICVKPYENEITFEVYNIPLIRIKFENFEEMCQKIANMKINFEENEELIRKIEKNYKDGINSEENEEILKEKDIDKNIWKEYEIEKEQEDMEIEEE